MDGLATVVSITTLNGVDGLGDLFAGRAVKVDLSRKFLPKREMMMVISRLLLRNKNTLTQLDLR